MQIYFRLVSLWNNEPWVENYIGKKARVCSNSVLNFQLIIGGIGIDMKAKFTFVTFFKGISGANLLHFFFFFIIIQKPASYAAFMCCHKFLTSHFRSYYKFVKFKCFDVGKNKSKEGWQVHSCLFLGAILQAQFQKFCKIPKKSIICGLLTVSLRYLVNIQWILNKMWCPIHSESSKHYLHFCILYNHRLLTIPEFWSNKFYFCCFK